MVNFEKLNPQRNFGSLWKGIFFKADVVKNRSI